MNFKREELFQITVLEISELLAHSGVLFLPVVKVYNMAKKKKSNKVKLATSWLPGVERRKDSCLISMFPSGYVLSDKSSSARLYLSRLLLLHRITMSWHWPLTHVFEFNFRIQITPPNYRFRGTEENLNYSRCGNILGRV